MAEMFDADFRKRRSLEKLKDELAALEAQRLEEFSSPPTDLDRGFMMNGPGSPAEAYYRDKQNREGRIGQLRDIIRGGSGELDYRAGRSQTIGADNELVESPMARSMVTLTGAARQEQAQKPKTVTTSIGGGNWGSRPPEGVGVSDEAAEYYTRQANMRAAQAMADEQETRAEDLRRRTDPTEQRRRMLEAEGDVRRRLGTTDRQPMVLGEDAEGRITGAYNPTPAMSPFQAESQTALRKADTEIALSDMEAAAKLARETEAWNSPLGAAQREHQLRVLRAPAESAGEWRQKVAMTQASAALQKAITEAKADTDVATLKALESEAERWWTLTPEQQSAAVDTLYRKIMAVTGRAPVSTSVAPRAGVPGDPGGIR